MNCERKNLSSMVAGCHPYITADNSVTCSFSLSQKIFGMRGVKKNSVSAQREARRVFNNCWVTVLFVT